MGLFLRGDKSALLLSAFSLSLLYAAAVYGLTYVLTVDQVAAPAPRSPLIGIFCINMQKIHKRDRLLDHFPVDLCLKYPLDELADPRPD
jgi:hypothetical protein